MVRSTRLWRIGPRRRRRRLKPLQQAAVAQQAGRTANAIASNAEATTATPPDTTASSAGALAATAKSEAIDNELKAVDDNIKADDARHERERRRIAQTSHRDHARRTGGGVGGTIRRIDVDGKRFNLQNGAPKQGVLAQAPQ